LTLAVTEFFTSIAGETSWSGLPCTFIRLAGCNLNCKWCDTTYAKKDGKRVNLDEAFGTILDAGTNLVCVTGGEPLMQEETPLLIRKLIRAKKKVLVETNGSFDIGIVSERAHRIVDVKTPGSGESKSFMLDNLGKLTKRDELKFVISNERDFNWTAKFVKKHDLESKCGLLVTPALTPGCDRSEFRILKRLLAERVLTSGIPFRYNIQLHKVIWGARRRGV